VVSQRVLCRAFIGRSAELDYLAACRRAAAASHGAGVMVLGEPGIGKSRLVREYQTRFCARAPAAVGTCRPFGQRAFDPLVEVLARLDAAAKDVLDGARSKEEQVDAILAAFERATAKRLTTAIVEDVQWAQPELIEMLAALARWAPNRRLLLILTCRDADVPPSSAKFTALARLARETSTVRLEPFEAGEITALMSGALADLEAVVPAATFGDVRRRAAGNPLFAEELLRHAVDEQRHGPSARTARALPLSLQGVIRERLDRCGARDREFLSAASVLGQRFHVDVLEAVFAIEHAAAVAALGRLIELQLIDRADDPLAYEFRHALTRDVVYGDLIPAQAHALHLRVAEAVEAMPEPASRTELLAHSFWEAGLLDRAAPYCELAGDSAMRFFAYEDAVVWFERAAGAFGDRAHDVGRALHKASVALNRLNEPKRAEPLYERAIAALVASGDVDAAVRTRTYLAATLYNDGRESDAVRAFEAALALARDAGLPESERHARIRLFTLRVLTRDLATATALLAAIDEAQLGPADRDTFDFYVAKSHLHTLCGEPDARRAAVARAFETLDCRGRPPNEERHALAYFASDAFGLGETSEARRYATAAVEVARRMRSELAYTLSVLAQIEARAGDLRLAREHLAAIVPAPEFLSRFERTITAIQIALATGDDELLAASLDLDLLREAERGGHHNSLLGMRATFAAALNRTGRRDEALRLARGFADAVTLPFGRAWDIVTVVELVPETAERLRAVVASSAAAGVPLNAAVRAFIDAVSARERGDAAATAAFARDASNGFAQVGWPIVRARALELAGDTTSALAIYRDTGCAADVRRIERAAPHAGVLSPRERELAGLVADGKNNREAADVLCVSLKAVEKYLTSIYRKLGVTSRTQLTSYVVSQRARDTLRS
jgi:DNA-binding NarL/FixJ family response regulator